MKIISLVAISLMSVGLMGCGNHGEYVKAVSDQNLKIHEMNLQHQTNKERENFLHEEKMSTLMSNAMLSAGATPDKMDDVLVPLLFASMEDKKVMADALSKNDNIIPFQKIEAPETFSEAIKNSTGLILGGAGVALGIVQSNNMADIAIAGISRSGTSTTYNTSGENHTVGSYNEANSGTQFSDVSLGESSDFGYNPPE